MTKNELQGSSKAYSEAVLGLKQIDVSTCTEVVIRAPAQFVWQYMTDDRQAKFSPHVYRVECGAWREVDSVFESHAVLDGKEQPYPKFRYRIVDSIPNKHYVWRMSMQLSPDSMETFVGYDIAILEESNGTTKVIFIQPLTFGNLNADLLVFRNGQREFIPPIFEELKRVVESEYNRLAENT
jgi:hypothetical protein